MLTVYIVPFRVFLILVYSKNEINKFISIHTDITTSCSLEQTVEIVRQMCQAYLFRDILLRMLPQRQCSHNIKHRVNNPSIAVLWKPGYHQHISKSDSYYCDFHTISYFIYSCITITLFPLKLVIIFHVLYIHILRHKSLTFCQFSRKIRANIKSN